MTVPVWLVAVVLCAQAVGDFALAWMVLGRRP